MQHQKTTTRHADTKGYIALVSVLIAGALLLLIGLGSALRGVDALTVAGGEESSLRAESLADACAEEALMKLSSNLSYSGNESIIVDGGETCMILPVSGSGNTNRIVTTQGTSEGYVRTVRVDIAQVTPTLSIRSFENVP